MVRKLRWVAVLLFVVLDVVLVTFAVQHTRSESAAGTDASVAVTVTVTTWSSTSSTDASTVASAVDPMRSATGRADADGTGRATAGSVTSASPARGSATAAGITAGSPLPDGPASVSTDSAVLLDLSSDGYVIRAASGTCQSGVGSAVSPAPIQVSRNDGLTWSTVASTAPAVVRVAAKRGGALWYVTADRSCHYTEHDSSDGGTTWRTGSPNGAWALAGTPNARSILSPSGEVQVGCEVGALAEVSPTAVIVACTNGTLRVSSDGGSTWQMKQGLAGIVGISFVDANTGYALAARSGCPAAVLRTADGAALWQQVACLSGGRPRAVAAAGTTVLAQVGPTLMISNDRGVTWRAVT